MPKQVPMQRHYKVQWPAWQSLALGTRKGCGSGKPPEIRDNDESNPEKWLKRATWKGKNFMITLSNCFEVIQNIYLQEPEVIYVLQIIFVHYHGGVCFVKNIHYSIDGNSMYFLSQQEFSILSVLCSQQSFKHYIRLEPGHNISQWSRHWTSMMEIFTAFGQVRNSWAQGTSIQRIFCYFLCFTSAGSSVLTHLNVGKGKIGQKKFGWYLELISFYFVLYNLKLILKLFHIETCINAKQKTQQNQ